MSKEKELGKICAGYTTYENFYIIDDSISDNLEINEFFFIDCQIQNLKITGSTNLTELLFVNCHITQLAIRDSRIPNMQFINCQIEDSIFIDSTLPRIVFSTRLSDKYDTLQEIPDGSESRLDNTQILFCEMNGMQIEHTHISNTDIKHCWLEKLKISLTVSMRDVDLRGTTIFDSDLGQCKFTNIRFGKKKYLVEIFRLFRKLKHHRLFRKQIGHQKKLNYAEKEKKEIDRYYNIFKKMEKQRKGDKKFNMPGALFDCFSSTYVETTSYEKADFSKGPHFYWYLNELEFFQIFEKRYPRTSRVLFILSNYMRSFGTLIASSLIYIFIFAAIFFFLCTCCNEDINFLKALLISVKTFLNMDISPFQPDNNWIGFWIIVEKILGYFALAFLVGKISVYIYQSQSLPPKKGVDE